MGPISADISGLHQQAFAVIGIDFSGPFHLKGAGRGPRAPIRSVLVITCLQNRAFHIEVCRDQTTYTVVMALIHFASLRGDPEKIYSNNQTIGTHKEVEDAYRGKQGKGPLWKTITPRTPHQGEDGSKWSMQLNALSKQLADHLFYKRTNSIQSFISPPVFSIPALCCWALQAIFRPP